MSKESDLAAKAIAGAGQGKQALERALGGDFDWDKLAYAIRAAAQCGCASKADVHEIEAKSLDIARIKVVLECLSAKALEGAPKGPNKRL